MGKVEEKTEGGGEWEGRRGWGGGWDEGGGGVRGRVAQRRKWGRENRGRG